MLLMLVLPRIRAGILCLFRRVRVLLIVSTLFRRLLRKLHAPHFDEAADCQRRDAPRDGDRFIAILALDQVVAAKLLLGLSEWPIGGQRLAVLFAHGDGGGAPFEFWSGEQLSALFDLLDEVAVVPHDPV